MPELRPNPGPQTKFLSCGADIILYGGKAGAGKTWALLVDPMRHLASKTADMFRCTTLRRTMPEIKKSGALWDTSMEVYPLIGGIPWVSTLTWKWPNGFKHEFGTLEHEKDLPQYQGAQFDQLQFDEVTTFTKKMFLFLFSRLRTTIEGLRPCVRMTCNPDPESWVLDLVFWYLDPEGYPDLKKCGTIRWLVVDNGVFVFADTQEELRKRYPKKRSWSFTFIPGELAPQLGDEYSASLDMLEEHDRLRLKEGNWFARRQGNIYKREMFQIVDKVTAKATHTTRFWDFAATADEPGKDPDFTAGVKVSALDNGQYLVEDAIEDRWEADGVETIFTTTAKMDGRRVTLRWEQEPGSAGKMVSAYLEKLVRGWDAEGVPSTGSKLERGKPSLAQARKSNVLLLKGGWNQRFLQRMEAFTGKDGEHDDLPDAFHGAMNDCIANAKDLPVDKILINPGGARRRGGYSE
jgi:predicted phage terminase large subunit-like protein